MPEAVPVAAAVVMSKEIDFGLLGQTSAFDYRYLAAFDQVPIHCGRFRG